MNDAIALQALQLLGERLGRHAIDNGTMTVYIVGGIAGMLSRQLSPERTTGDCDVMRVEPDGQWPAIEQEAMRVGGELGIGNGWFNRTCGMYAWQMPLGWQRRCIEAATFGPLRVMVLCRGDLIASKVMGAAKRAQDRADLLALRPTAAELAEVDAHLDRVESETESGYCDPNRAVVQWLRESAGGQR